MRKHCSETQIENAILTTPQKANISKYTINRIANSCISKENWKTSVISFVAGIPGGWAMIGTVTGDLIQYFAHIIIISQKLAYLYGWPQLFSESNFIDEEFDSDSANILLGFIALMFSVEGAGNLLQNFAKNFSTSKMGRDIIRKIAQQSFYKPLQKILQQMGLKLNQKIMKQFFAKAVPVAGAFLSGSMTFISFKFMCNKFKNEMAKIELVA